MASSTTRIGESDLTKVLTAIASLSAPTGRTTNARALAHLMGADDLLVFMRDDETGVFLTAPGFIGTLPDGRRWQAFLSACVTRGEHSERLPLQAGAPEMTVRGYASSDEHVAVVVGHADPRAFAIFASQLPLVTAALRGERAVALAELRARQSSAEAARSATLARTLDLARRKLEEALRSLSAQAAVLRETTQQLQVQQANAEEMRAAAESAAQQLRVVFAQAPAAVAVTTGPEHRYVLANPRYEELVGRQVTLGATFRDVLPEVADQGYEAMLDQVWVTGQARVENEAHARVDKGGPQPEDGWYSFVYQPLFDHTGSVTGIMQHGIEVTAQVRARLEVERLLEESERQRVVVERARGEAESARQRAEEVEAQFRSLVDAIPTLAWTADRDGFIDWYNARWYEYTGTDPESMRGWGWTSVHDPAVLPDVMTRWQASIRSGEPFEMTFPLRGRDGVFRRFLTRVVPTRDSGGRVVRWFGTNTDVEDQARLRAAAEEANRAKGEFLAVMSHELRTPLNAIDGYAELLEMGIPGELSPLQRDFLSKIRKSQRHLLGLINGVLNYARVEAGGVHFSDDVVRVHDALSSCEELVAPQAFAKGLTLTYEECDRDVCVRADSDKLQQVVLNLLTNATKFTDAGGRIVLSCGATGDAVRICVKDTGRGIAADQVPRVFEPFVQLDAQLTRRNDGVGLGLAISRDLARGMGGDLTVESEVGVGSVFTLELPRA